MNEKFLYQNKIFRDRRKELRNNATEAEKILWGELKCSKLGVLKFVRQYSVGPYILDFYCPKLRLAIELDGSQHGEQDAILYDKDRSDYLEAVHIKVLRFKNMEIVNNLKGSLNKILNKALEVANPS
jgi:very-short-patch-repair endonuclease